MAVDPTLAGDYSAKFNFTRDYADTRAWLLTQKDAAANLRVLDTRYARFLATSHFQIIEITYHIGAACITESIYDDDILEILDVAESGDPVCFKIVHYDGTVELVYRVDLVKLAPVQPEEK